MPEYVYWIAIGTLLVLVLILASRAGAGPATAKAVPPSDAAALKSELKHAKDQVESLTIKFATRDMECRTATSELETARRKKDKLEEKLETARGDAAARGRERDDLSSRIAALEARYADKVSYLVEWADSVDEDLRQIEQLNNDLNDRVEAAAQTASAARYIPRKQRFGNYASIASQQANDAFERANACEQGLDALHALVACARDGAFDLSIAPESRKAIDELFEAFRWEGWQEAAEKRKSEDEASAFDEQLRLKDIQSMTESERKLVAQQKKWEAVVVFDHPGAKHPRFKRRVRPA